jgi:hypothetical protein
MPHMRQYEDPIAEVRKFLMCCPWRNTVIFGEAHQQHGSYEAQVRTDFLEKLTSSLAHMRQYEDPVAQVPVHMEQEPG